MPSGYYKYFHQIVFMTFQGSYRNLFGSVEHLLLEKFVEKLYTMFATLEDQLGRVRIDDLGLGPGRIVEKAVHGLAAAEERDLVRVKELSFLGGLKVN